MDGQTPHHGRKNSVSSPGLEALAAAASNTTPLIPPTHAAPYPPGSLQHTFHHPSHQNGAQSHESHYHQSTVTPDLAPYHHTTNGEQKEPVSDDQPQSLTPPQQIPTSQSNSLPVIEPDDPKSQLIVNDNKAESPKQSLHIVDSHLAHDSQGVTSVTTQKQQPSPGPNQTLPAVSVSEAQSEQVHVKTELNDVPMLTTQDDKTGVLQAGDVHMVID